MNSMISRAEIKPGTAARKNACRQPHASAIGTSTSGATVEPSRLEPRFCAMPCATPRRSGATSAATIAWLIGITPPSDSPITSRAASSIRNV